LAAKWTFIRSPFPKGITTFEFERLRKTARLMLCYGRLNTDMQKSLDQADLGSDNEQNGDSIIAPEDEWFTAET
jgi:hypothetical protein